MRPILITLLLVASNAHAENWLQVANLNPKGGILSVDTSNIDRASDLRNARFKSVYPADRPIGDAYRRVTPDVRSYRWELSLGRFDCAERTIAVSQSTLYGADDQAVASLDADKNALKLRNLAPQSLGWLMLQAVCAPATADGPPKPLARLTRPVNPDDFYPSASLRRGEEGSPVLNVCVGPTGKLLREPEITDTSGFPDLDSAAIKAAAAMSYGPAIENDAAAAESCIKFKIKFVRLHR